MTNTTYDHNLGFLGMLIRASDFDPLYNGNPFAPPTYPIPAPVNSIGTDYQITEVVRLYKDYKEKFITYFEFCIILISIITNKCPKQYTTTLKHCITKFLQCIPLTLLSHLYTDYRTITSSNLAENSNFRTARCNPPTPIFFFFSACLHVPKACAY